MIRPIVVARFFHTGKAFSAPNHKPSEVAIDTVDSRYVWRVLNPERTLTATLAGAWVVLRLIWFSMAPIAVVICPAKAAEDKATDEETAAAAKAADDEAAAAKAAEETR